jgi:hypothetical protein
LTVEILPETSKVAAGLKRALLKADDDIRDAAKRWKRIIDRELGDADAEVEVTADVSKARKEIEKVEKGRYEAKIRVDVDKASLAKARATISRAGGGAGGGAGALGALKSLGKGEALVAGVGLAPNIVPLMGQIVTAAGQLSGVLGLIPAAAGAAGLAIGSLKIATLGFGDAIKAVGDPEKFAESLQTLTPAATAAPGRAVDRSDPRRTASPARDRRRDACAACDFLGGA